MQFNKFVSYLWHYNKTNVRPSIAGQIASNLLKNKTTKFGFKLGLVAGATYYLSDQGVWRDSDTTRELYDKMKTNISPYTQEISKQIPYEFPSLPSTGEFSYLTKYYWNKGVIASFSFLANVPSYISEYSAKGVDAILDNTEVKNLIASDTNTKK